MSGVKAIHVQGAGGVNFKSWSKFVNSKIKNTNFRWIANNKKGQEWIIKVNENEAQQWRNLLDNTFCFNNKVSASIRNCSQNSHHHNNKNSRRKKNRFNDSSNRNFRSGRNNKYSTVFNQQLTPTQISEFNQVLQNRYNGEQHMLDLSNICTNENDNWLSFSNTSFVNELLSVIQSNCIGLQTIDFSNNCISTLETLKKLNEFAPMLENISLTDNPIKSFAELDYLAQAFSGTLKELHLRNNILLAEVSGVSQLYLHEVIRRFKALRLVDNEVIPPTIVSFGANIDHFQCEIFKQCKLPVSCHSPSKNNPIIQTFLESYFAAFDGNRENLLGFYKSTQSVFSLTFVTDDSPTPIFKSETHRQYQKDVQHCDRNLKNFYFQRKDRQKQCSNVLHGARSIVSFLAQKFPRTQHGITLMAIDSSTISVNSANFLQLLVIGYYAEVGDSNDCRKFQRTFLLVPDDSSGMVIVNDQLHIGGPIMQQIVLQHCLPASMADQQLRQQQGKDLIVPNDHNNNNSNDEQQQKIQAVAQHCNVDANVAQQALQASDWNPSDACNKILALIAQAAAQQQINNSI